ncbi:hypothetical protein DVH05_011571 [Phytophthora capsici]|nr:hypothetical protein DVH05_011571 [Phytophthora capsici]
MDSSVCIGTLAFLGPAHLDQLLEFQYVEVVAVKEDTVIVKTTGPDDDSEADDHVIETFEAPLDVIKVRRVPEAERRCWPGSFVAHPVAFRKTTKDGVDVWDYGVVAGYTSADTTDILHIVGRNEPTRHPLTDLQSVIKVDPLTYALQPGGGTNSTALNPLELLHQQDTLLAACRRRKNGIPAAVMAGLSVPFSPDELVPLVKPSSLQLVRVRRQHLVDFVTAPRLNRPGDLYTDSAAGEDDVTACGGGTQPVGTTHPLQSDRSNTKRPVQRLNHRLSDAEEESDFSECEDVREVRHMNASLVKRRRTDDDNAESDSSCGSSRGRYLNEQRGIVFHPSPSDRRIHGMVVNRRHTGKVAQTLLQSVQQSPHVEFLASPAVLRGLYSFGFGLGLSIMHCRRVRWDDEVATTEKGVNLWDFSSKNNLPTPPKANSFGELISALTTLHKFALHFYNSTTSDFISAARDFIIDYADHARTDSTMARLLAHWINGKFSLFRSTLLVEGLASASGIASQFCRSDDKLSALRDSCQAWKPTSHSNRARITESEKGPRPQRTPASSRIPTDVYAKLPKADDDRRVCLKFLSKVGCQYANCSSAHFRPPSLPEGAKAVVKEKWGGFATEYQDL